MPADPIALPYCAEAIVANSLQRPRRVMVLGPMGSGKSTLVGEIADVLVAAGRTCLCLSADPGTPAFGPPGALALGRRRPSLWDVDTIEPLCSLDAGRFRLPLMNGVRRLAGEVDGCVLLLDPPGVVRGVVGRELLHALVSAAAVDLMLFLARPGDSIALSAELAALSVEQIRLDAHPDARRPGPRTRSRSRTAAWDQWLVGSVRKELSLEGLAITGAPPPTGQPNAWVGRQIAILGPDGTSAMGEVLETMDTRLAIRVCPPLVDPVAILIRDALRGPDGLLHTAVPFAPGPVVYLPPAAHRDQVDDGGPRPVARVGAMDAVLVNGIFGDPLLHVRIRHLGRSLLFDLGEGGRLSARLAHQVTDCFISHAHMDHLSGFIWLLRSRLGELPPCRLYGPPGLARHVQGLVQGFLWDRIGDCGPAFEITELHGDRLEALFLQAGHDGLRPRGSRPAPEGILLEEPGFRVRAVTLDHGGTPVLAFALEPADEVHVRKDRLLERGLSPGPWLNQLKSGLRTGPPERGIELPNGSSQSVEALGRDLTLTVPGKRLIYATDLADSPANRAWLINLARDAHTLFLESTYTEADRNHAEANGHLTARACGEIAEAAGVARLVPLHLSRRYQRDPSELLDELQAACPRAVLPRP